MSKVTPNLNYLRDGFVALGDGQDELRAFVREARLQEWEGRPSRLLATLMGVLEDLVRTSANPYEKCTVQSIVHSLEKCSSDIEAEPRLRSVRDSLRYLVEKVRRVDSLNDESVMHALESLLLDVDYYRSRD